VTKGKRSALAARAVALVVALALAALAARLWLGGGPPSGGLAASGTESGAAIGRDEAAAGAEREASASAPPLHEPHSAQDQQALRDILRGAEKKAP
jgi:hypothetical protein